VLDKLAAIQRPLGLATLLLLALGTAMAWNAPLDFQQGNAVRILYIHVPSAKLSLLLYLGLVIAAVAYLWRGSETADILAEAAAPVGAVFAAVTLASGAIWGKPMWGAWWAWDARLTSMLMLFIIYIGLIVLRDALGEPRKAARASAILAIIGVVDLVFIHFSVTWWRTLHQPASFSGTSKSPSITGSLLTPLLIMSLAFILMGLYLWIVKARTVAARRHLETLEMESWTDE
jgi:heme exporter protein C